jgi:1-acyl-sn-glycerol-3-phosphate acyltransferase
MQPETKTDANQYATADYQIQKILVCVAQLAIYPLLLILRLLIVRNKVYRNKEILSLGKNGARTTYVLYANHQSKLDPLIICAALPVRTVGQLLPFRFFVENSYFRGPMKLFLNAMGCFPAHYETNKQYGLDGARAFMASEQTIVIFPPGMRTRDHIAKSGISVLATEPNTRLVPIHIDWKHRWSCHVRIGAPIKGEVTHPPEKLMQHVYELAESPSS